jgi:hypothetical protein
LTLSFSEVTAVVGIDVIDMRYCLWIRDIDSFPLGEPFIKGIFHFARTFLCTGSTGNAFFRIDIGRLLKHRDLKIAGLSRNALHLGVGDNINV